MSLTGKFVYIYIYIHISKTIFSILFSKSYFLLSLINNAVEIWYDLHIDIETLLQTFTPEAWALFLHDAKLISPSSATDSAIALFYYK